MPRCGTGRRAPDHAAAAITSHEAKGSFTEAGQVVGEISLHGTLELMIFGGLPAGFLAGVLYAVLRPVLPRAARAARRSARCFWCSLARVSTPCAPTTSTSQSSARALAAARIALAVVLLVALRGFVGAVAEIT